MSDIEAFVIGGISFSFSRALIVFYAAGDFCFINAISTQTDRGGELNTVSLKAALFRAAFNFLNPSKYPTMDAMDGAFLPTFQSNGGTTS